MRELRTFGSTVERYMAGMSHLHTMHRTDLSALALIMDGKGNTPKALSEQLSLSPPATSAMLARLELAGHVRRSPMTDDRRSVHIEVTESAMAVGASMFGLLARHIRPVLDGHDPAELRRLTEILQQLVAAANSAIEHTHPAS